MNNFVQQSINQQQPQVRAQSRKSNGPASATGSRRRVQDANSPDIFKNVANQSLGNQSKLPQALGKQGTPLKNNMKKLLPSRPSSAQSKNAQVGASQKLGSISSSLPSASNKTGQSLQGLNISGFGQGQGLQGVQTNSQKLRMQQQLQQMQ